jgi:hypothetical protein
MPWRVPLQVFLTIVCVLAVATGALAQPGTGSLHGRVIDPQGAAIGGARVSIGGPIGEQSQLTDAAGRFRFLALPPGSYAVKVEREGITPVGHPNVTVRVGRSTVIEITSTPGGHQSLGTSESALLDKRVIATGANLRYEQLEKIPFAPDLASLLQSTPGVMLDVVNIGGSMTGERPTVAFRGASRDANTWTVDGVTMTDMAAPGLAPRFFDFAFLEEVQTITGGPAIQQMTAGVGVNVVTRRGTNLFQRSARLFFANAGALNDDMVPIGGTDFDGSLAFGADAGGAIVKDRLWYFAGLDGIWTDRETAAGTASHDFSRTSLAGNIAWNPGRHSFAASVFTTAIGRNGIDAGPLRAAGALWNDDGRTTLMKVQDSVAIGSRWFATGLAAFADTGFTLEPEGTAAAHIDANGVFRDGFQRVTADRTSKEARIDLTGYFGTHEVQAGVGHRAFSAGSLYEWPGGVVSAASGTPVTTLILPPDRDVAASAGYTAGYIQDTITHGRLTANFGLRFDVQRGHNRSSAAIANANSVLVPAVTFGGDDQDWNWTSVVPRIGVTYALGPDGITLLRAAVSRYTDQLGVDRILALNPIAPIAGHEFDGGERFAFFDANGNRQLDPGEVRSASTIIRAATTDPRFLEPLSVVDDDFKPPMTTELLLGADRLLGRGAVSAHLQWRSRGDIVDDVPLVIEAASGVRRPVVAADFGSGPVVPVTDVDGAPLVLETFALAPGLAYTGGVFSTNGAREQSAVDMTLQYDQRYVRGAYVRAWINFGRASWSVPTTFFVDRNDLLGAEDNDGAPAADQSASPARRDVFLNNTWSYELFGMTRAPFGLEVAGRFYGRQGYPAPVFVTVPAGDATRLIQVGDLDRVRFARLFLMDLRVERPFVVANFNLDLSAEVFNLFSRQTLLQRDADLRSETRGEPVEFVSPRVLRFGVRVRF